MTNFSDGYWPSLGKPEARKSGEKTALQELECIIKERRVRWFGHESQMDGGRLPKQVTHWEVNTTKRRMGRPRKNCNDTIRQDLKDIGML